MSSETQQQLQAPRLLSWHRHEPSKQAHRRRRRSHTSRRVKVNETTKSADTMGSQQQKPVQLSVSTQTTATKNEGTSDSESPSASSSGSTTTATPTSASTSPSITQEVRPQIDASAHLPQKQLGNITLESNVPDAQFQYTLSCGPLPTDPIFQDNLMQSAIMPAEVDSYATCHQDRPALPCILVPLEMLPLEAQSRPRLDHDGGCNSHSVSL
eukprot:TRINITY_DN9921_c0_g1_i1.p1 TRINITY_DN9921_c0_g1~~TRINITY_DN9921_c0_g1_i1.p1  ORF type:complete len:212 (-),score=42.69 TRINITY_DN9921_c0_g1_i1:249-884(-)